MSEVQNNEPPAWVVWLFGVFVGLIVSALATANYMDSVWESLLVKRGLAQYNPKTAVFEWVEPETTFQQTLDTIEANSVKELEADVDAYMKRVCP